MKKRVIFKKLIITVSASIILLFFLFGYSTATVYPSYENETDCRNCHQKTPSYIGDRHHTLVANGTYHCSDCHPMLYDEINETLEPQTITNCQVCHVNKSHKDVHHILASRELFECQDCHPLQWDELNQTWDPYVTYDCTECHNTVRSIQNGTPVPTPTPTPIPPNPNPIILGFDPVSPVSNTVGDTRTFSINTDQITNVTWSVENVNIQTYENVTNSSYTNISVLGVRNVTANASNENGTVQYTWLWNVTDVMRTPLEIEFYAPYPYPISPVIDSTGDTRKFGLALNQAANITWSINGTEVQFNETNCTVYTNLSASFGTWIVEANASNSNGTVSYTWLWVVQDDSPPNTSIILSGNSGNNGWNTSNVLVSLFATDTGGSGLSGTLYRIDNSTWNSYTVPFEIVEEGIHNISYYSVDNDNNVEPINYQIVKIDKTLPQITINAPANGTIYQMNQYLTANFQCSDTISGISACTGTYSNGSVINTSSPGTKYFNVNAIDNAGNYIIKNNTYYIKYLFGGYLQPIENDNTSIFKLGSNVPIKFQLTDANGNWVTTANVSLTVSYESSTSGTINEQVYSGAVSTGYYFTYDGAGHFYMYNLGTKNAGFSQGKYKLTSILDDGSSYPVLISLKR